MNKTNSSTKTYVVKSPWGAFGVDWDGKAVTACKWLRSAKEEDKSLPAPIKQLKSWFQGKQADLQNVPIDWNKLTPFQARVAKTLRKVPRGRTVSYRSLASMVGSPRAARAVGRAMATNPFPILVPCHRVIKNSGELGNFSSPGGAETKMRILQFERTDETAPLAD